MTRPPRRAFQPCLDRLDVRLVLSGVTPTAEISLAKTRALAPVTPGPASVALPGNSILSAAQWTGLHTQYVARNRTLPEIVAIGDSVMYFWGDPRRRDISDFPTPWGTASWESGVASLGSAANYGIPGDGTGDVLWRIQQGELSSKPKVVIVSIGINNLGNGDTPQDTASGIANIVNTIRTNSPETQILLLGLLPPYGSATNPVRLQVDQVNTAIAKLAGDHVTFENPDSLFLNPDGAPIANLLQNNGYHPTVAGYRVLTHAITPILQKLLHE